MSAAYGFANGPAAAFASGAGGGAAAAAPPPPPNPLAGAAPIRPLTRSPYPFTSLSPVTEVQVPITVHSPLSCPGFSAGTKLRKSGLMVVDRTSAAVIDLAATATTAGPGSLILCFGWMLTRRNLPASPSVSV